MNEAVLLKPIELTEEELDFVTGGAQPQSGQPGLTEGQNGPPPFPNGNGSGGQPQSGQPGLTEGQNGPPPYPNP
jgi:hypothetical protein